MEEENETNTNAATCIFFKTQESAHYHCDMSAYTVKSDINNRSNMGPLHKTLIILKVDRYYGLFHWKRGFTVHFGFKKKKKRHSF